MIDGALVSMKRAVEYTDGTETITALEMNEPFRLRGPAGAERFKKGDYLVLDVHGRYGMPKERFEERYRPWTGGFQ